jgi:GT2 family glycosyltransferase
VNNASTENYNDVKEYIANTHSIPFKYFDAPENLGVTKGRNYALQYASGETIIFLDDDAVLQNADALQNVAKAFDKPGVDGRPVGIVSFKVVYYENGQMQENALPHKQFDSYKDKPEFFTYYFAGGAHAIKKNVLDDVGQLPADFFYGMEEYDLSYRILDKGYCIKYDASIVMLHKESPLGRKPRTDKLRMMWVNKATVAYRYLPLQFFYSTSVMWSIEYLRKTSFDIRGWLKGWKLIFQIPSHEKRTLVQPSTLQYLRNVHARLWY